MNTYKILRPTRIIMWGNPNLATPLMLSKKHGLGFNAENIGMGSQRWNGGYFLIMIMYF
ncbi:hypothetical protein [Salegentibacter salinarum]|uniref:hypothetical protein n=1 Tax=Salegentibacter salinarum TaxID=447422 RepID=UPI0012FEAD18|nr:hypothetical protein [Salegentibacter salinarum]